LSIELNEEDKSAETTELILSRLEADQAEMILSNVTLNETQKIADIRREDEDRVVLDWSNNTQKLIKSDNSRSNEVNEIEFPG
jgi:hypothetical protein